MRSPSVKSDLESSPDSETMKILLRTFLFFLFFTFAAFAYTNLGGNLLNTAQVLSLTP